MLLPVGPQPTEGIVGEAEGRGATLLAHAKIEEFRPRRCMEDKFVAAGGCSHSTNLLDCRGHRFALPVTDQLAVKVRFSFADSVGIHGP